MIILLFYIVTFASTNEEYVRVIDLTRDTGLPERLTVDVVKEGGSVARLHLKQNKRLNENAPVYQAPKENGIPNHVKRETKQFTDFKFYHDGRNGAALSVTCDVGDTGRCRRSLEGYLNIGEETYEIHPAIERSASSKRGETDNTENIHLISRVAQFKRHPQKSADSPYLHDKEFIESVITSRQTERKETKTEYAVEIIVIADPYLWKKYYDKSEEKADMTKDEATEYQIRRKLAHIINGVSLRYESIEDPYFSVYVTISAFKLYKNIDDTSPVPEGNAVQFQDDIPYADADAYLENLVAWQFNLVNMQHDDHLMVFTGCELYSNGNISDTAVAGQAYLGGACSFLKVSIQEDGDYFTTTTVAAHELGHNLGAYHDGDNKSKSCKPADMYVMAPSVSQLFATEKYTVNPWRFSSCSIDSFRSFFQGESGKCLTDHGDYYDKDEWDKHNQKLPGELHSLDQQCKLINGDYSGYCYWQIAKTDERLCRDMRCISKPKGTCSIHTPAQGSPCGNPTDNKWCIEGKCVPKFPDRDETNPSSPPGQTTKPPKKEPEECFSTIAKNYKGNRRTTKTGKTCIPWTETNHLDASDFPDDTVAEASNYCRSPDNDSLTWCFFSHGSWDYCDIEKCKSEECFSTIAKNYKGNRRTTKTGKTCLPWTETNHLDASDFPDDTVAEASNYCRSPDNDSLTWCFYSHGSWEHCDIGKCKPENYECFETTSDKYAGTRSTSLSGYTCMRWEVTAYSDNFPDPSVEAAANYCRDPDGTGQPWCFIESPPATKDWELCDIPKC